MAAGPNDVFDKMADQVAVKHKEKSSSDARVKSPTSSGLPIEDQVRKEWDPNKDGGLPEP